MSVQKSTMLGWSAPQVPTVGMLDITNISSCPTEKSHDRNHKSIALMLYPDSYSVMESA